MRCKENEPISLGALLSQVNDAPQTSKQHSMLSSLCGSTVSLKSITTSSSSKNQPPPPSPTTSVSNSNVLPTSELNTNCTTNNPNTLIQALKFDAELDGEVQSPVENSIWDSIFSDQIDPSSDFMLISSPRRDFMMVSSPRRDYMISSPRRDYMISSPRRDFMVSSPKRDYMMCSPKREYMISSPKKEYMVSTVASPKRMGMSNMNASIYNHNYGYGSGINSQAYSLKGKAQSPLHKVLNSSTAFSSCSSSSTQYGVHSETLALPTIDALLYEYGLYSNPEIYDVSGTEEAVEGMTTTLLECMSMPSLNMKYAESVGVGVQLSNGCDHHGDDGDHGHGHGHGHNGYGMCQQMMGAGGVTKTEITADGSSYHGFMGTSGCDQNEQDQDDSGLQLVHLLLACAESISKSDYVSARRYLHHLNRTVSPLGDSMQRVASCFADALSSRLNPPLNHHNLLPSNPSLETLKIYQILYQACPYIKFAHFTANQAIFEAFETEDRVHVIDLDILQGYQWPAFLQALAARPGGPPSLRITGVGYPAEIVRESGRQLANLAHSLRVPFEFHAAVAERLEDLQPHMLHRRVGEALAVNSVNRLHRVLGPHLGNLLAMIRDQAPNIVTLVEQEASHNGTHFLGRFLEALHYYSAIFDSLDATFPPDSAARAKVEQYIILPEIRNIVACEGPDRIERHERLEKWRMAMEGKGFTEVPLSQNALTQSNILLGLYSCEGYRLTQDRGCLLLGWQDRAIVAASAWRC